MANNSLSNGKIQQATVCLKNDRAKKDIPAIENRNWLLHKHYTRHEYRICKILIEEELIKSNGHNEYANYLKGLILRKEGKVHDSLDCFQTCYDVNPRNVGNVKQIAKSLLLLGSHKRALEAYLEAEKMSITPDWEIFHSLGECYAKLNRTSDAKRYLKKSIELTTNEIPYLELAKLHVEAGQIEEAIKVYLAALEASPGSQEAATELGLLYLQIGDTQQAFQHFGNALAQNSNCTRALLPMASIMQNHREYDVALSKYKTAAQSLAESPTLWNNVGMCFYGKQKFVAAISCLKRAHYLNPLALLPACNLGIVLLSTGQPASAAVYLCAAISADPKESLAYLLLGLALRQLRDLEGSEKALIKAYSLAPQDPRILVNFAVVLEAKGKKQNAMDILAILYDIIAVSEVDSEIIETARKLSANLQRTGRTENPEERVLGTDEV